MAKKKGGKGKAGGVSAPTMYQRTTYLQGASQTDARTRFVMEYETFPQKRKIAFPDAI
jgi:hypothetical protein